MKAIATLILMITCISCVSTAPISKAAPVSCDDNSEIAMASFPKTQEPPADIKTAMPVITPLITIIQNPTAKKTIYKNKPFGSPYIISVTADDAPLSNCDITVTYPASRDNDVITYAVSTITTDETGRATFTPDASTIAVDDVITFSAAANKSDSVSATYSIKSDVVGAPGGILYVYDFNEKGQPTRENFALLKYLRNAGVNAGNCPISDITYLNRDAYALYKTCKPIVTGQANFLIYGTFKYLESHDNEVTLQADVVCLSMADGRELYKTSITQSAKASDKRTADTNCRDSIAATLARDVMYAM